MGRVYRHLHSRFFWIKYHVDGEVVRESTRSVHRGEAVKFLRSRMEKIAAGTPSPAAIERTTLAELEQALLDDYRVNGRRPAPRVAIALAHLKAHFGRSCRLVTLSFERLNAYVAERMKSGRTAATARCELSALKHGFRLLERAGKARTPPFPTISVQNARKGFIEAEELAAILHHLPEDLRPLIEFLDLTGWRLRQETTLRWNQVDFVGGVARLEPGSTKSGEGRTFPFAALPPLTEVLRRQRQRVTALEQRLQHVIPFVFTWSRRFAGEPLRDFRLSWRRASRAAGCPGRLVHDLRRGAVRRLERCGVSRSVAMKLTGHKTEAVYRRYAIVSERDLSDGIAKVAEALRRAGDLGAGPVDAVRCGQT
jgi:site-specific recombinase XerD